MLRETKEALDPEVVNCVAILNQFDGVETFSSCSGHGYDLCYLAFYCSNLNSLERIIRGVNAVRWDCKDDLDPEVHLWQVVIIPSRNYKSRIEWDILWQDRDKGEGAPIKTKEAWEALEKSLEKERGNEFEGADRVCSSQRQ